MQTYVVCGMLPGHPPVLLVLFVAPPLVTSKFYFQQDCALSASGLPHSQQLKWHSLVTPPRSPGRRTKRHIQAGTRHSLLAPARAAGAPRWTGSGSNGLCSGLGAPGKPSGAGRDQRQVLPAGRRSRAEHTPGSLAAETGNHSPLSRRGHFFCVLPALHRDDVLRLVKMTPEKQELPGATSQNVLKRTLCVTTRQLRFGPLLLYTDIFGCFPVIMMWKLDSLACV